MQRRIPTPQSIPAMRFTAGIIESGGPTQVTRARIKATPPWVPPYVPAALCIHEWPQQRRGGFEQKEAKKRRFEGTEGSGLGAEANLRAVLGFRSVRRYFEGALAPATSAIRHFSQLK